MSINQKSGRQTFRRKFVSGSLFVSPCPTECNFQSETKIEPDLRLGFSLIEVSLYLRPREDKVAHSLLVLRLYFGPLKTVTILVTFPR